MKYQPQFSLLVHSKPFCIVQTVTDPPSTLVIKVAFCLALSKAVHLTDNESGKEAALTIKVQSAQNQVLPEPQMTQ